MPFFSSERRRWCVCPVDLRPGRVVTPFDLLRVDGLPLLLSLSCAARSAATREPSRLEGERDTPESNGKTGRFDVEQPHGRSSSFTATDVREVGGRFTSCGRFERDRRAMGKRPAIAAKTPLCVNATRHPSQNSAVWLAQRTQTPKGPADQSETEIGWRLNALVESTARGRW